MANNRGTFEVKVRIKSINSEFISLEAGKWVVRKSEIKTSWDFYKALSSEVRNHQIFSFPRLISLCWDKMYISNQINLRSLAFAGIVCGYALF